MAKENEDRMTEEKLQHRVEEAIDELGDATKKATRKVFNGMAARTAEVFSEMLDKQKIIIKNKIRGNKDGEEEPQ